MQAFQSNKEHDSYNICKIIFHHVWFHKIKSKIDIYIRSVTVCDQSSPDVDFEVISIFRKNLEPSTVLKIQMADIVCCGFPLNVNPGFRWFAQSGMKSKQAVHFRTHHDMDRLLHKILKSLRIFSHPTSKSYLKSIRCPQYICTITTPDITKHNLSQKAVWFL